MMTETWKPIIIEQNGVKYDFTDKYEVSNLGRVRALNYRRKGIAQVMKLRKGNRNGYMHITLEGTTFSIHRLVATMFIPNPNNLPVVNHRDENPGNNCIDNLEWCTSEYNNNYGTKNQKMKETLGKVICKKVRCIETGEVFDSITLAAEWAGVTSGISIYLAGKQDSAGKHPETGEKLHWEYYYDEELALAN